MVNEGLGFKPPTPRIYSGDNEDRDASNLDAWINEVKDYIEMLSITDDKTKLLLLQYFLSKTAKDFYHTKRQEAGITFAGFLENLKEYIIPSTQINRYWDDWYKISQVHGGKIERITATAIRLEKAANRLGTAISNQVKVQRFLDAMHPELRYAVEPDVKDRATANWNDIKRLAERKDAALFQAGKYGKTKSGDTHQRTTSNAVNTPFKQQSKPRKLTPQEKERLRRERRCYYCKKVGHTMNECRTRQRNQQQGKFTQSACTTVDITEVNAVSLNEFLERHVESAATTHKVNHMVTMIKVNGHPARTLLDTGTTGSNLMSNHFAQTHNIQTKELEEPITIHMATKRSRANAKSGATANIEICVGHRLKAKFLVVAISAYDIILGMPFLQENVVTLNTAESTAHFGRINYTLHCTTKNPRTNATTVSAATSNVPDAIEGIIENPRMNANTDCDATLNAPDRPDSPRMNSITDHTTTLDVPDFDKIFPKLFPEKEPDELPPLRPGCNHKVLL